MKGIKVSKVSLVPCHRCTICADNDRRVSSYRLPDIDPALWRRVKTRAASEGRTVKSVLLALLRVYAEHGYDVVDNLDPEKE